MSNNTDLMESVVHASVARNMLVAEYVKQCAPLIALFCSMWVPLTMPNHPQSYTEEEIKAHQLKKAGK